MVFGSQTRYPQLKWIVAGEHAGEEPDVHFTVKFSALPSNVRECVVDKVVLLSNVECGLEAAGRVGAGEQLVPVLVPLGDLGEFVCCGQEEAWRCRDPWQH